ncbi:MAG: rhodanese-like domain-containing protein [Microbacteriaceae bacterium]|nr:rhodanese-like domain-containing protein [Burkholderiaceae bacterium]
MTPSAPKTVQSMFDEAMALITTLPVVEARALHGQAGVLFVDLRDPRELAREGGIPGAFHAPRGMLEFWVDPASPYYKPVLNQPDTRYVLFCAGGLRSALAARTMQEMGVAQVAHIEGGFGAWRAAGAPVAEVPVGKGDKPPSSAGPSSP